MNRPLPSSIFIDFIFTPQNAEPSINWTFRGITIDESDDLENACDSIRVKHGSDSNVIDKIESQYEKHSEQRI
jgi:hypothetical protein